jgi:prepilin-type N-terminal cleavage/methylation domain-containing protein
MEKRNSFTLIELLIAMALMAVLAILIIGNFNSSLKRGRDAQRKNDLNSLQKALEAYYEDNKTYPTSTDIFGKELSYLSPSYNKTTYMIKTPQDPSSAYTYIYEPETPVNGRSSYYYLYSYLENSLDEGSGVSQTGFTNGKKCNVAGTVNCLYYISSSNAPILTPNP